MDFVPPFGHWLKEHRQQLGMTQGDLARRVGCATVTIRKIESGERQPSPLLAERMGQQLEIADPRQADFVAFAIGAPAIDHAPKTGNIPVATTPLIGRADELAHVRKLLHQQKVRLVTLIGPPGVGKTRLAVQVAANLSSDFGNGAWFVRLASTTDPEQVPLIIATTLGVNIPADKVPLDGIKHYLRDKHLLLVLDNLEQLPAAAPQIAELLAVAPDLVTLATSRAPLHLTGEYEVHVPPLALPDRQKKLSLAALARCPSVELFTQRARAVKPGFALNEANADTVVEICHRLDGLPLALELAAARVRLLAPSDLLAGLAPRSQTDPASASQNQPSFQLLSGGPHDLLPRQQTLWNTIDWSYNLLSVGEQAVFRRLSIFIDGCTLPAAVAVCGDGPIKAGNDGSSLSMAEPTFTALQSLMEASLLQQSAGNDAVPRYRMLEMIREYALARLNEQGVGGEGDAVRQRHADYFAQLTEPTLPLPMLFESGKLVTLRCLYPEFGNMLAALAWCQTQNNLLEMELNLATMVAECLSFDAIMGCPQRVTTVVRARLVHTLERSVATLPALRARLLHSLIDLECYCDHITVAISYGEESVILYHQVGDRTGEADALRALAWVAYNANDFAYAERVLESSLRLQYEVGDETHLPATLCRLASIRLDQGRLDEADTMAEESLAIQRRLGEVENPGTACTSLLILGLIAQLKGDAERSVGLLQQALQLLSQNEYIKTGNTWWLWYLGRAYIMLDRFELAVQIIEQGLDSLRGNWQLSGIKSVSAGLDELAVVRWAQDRRREAAALVAAAEKVRRYVGSITPITWLASDHEHMLTLVCAQLHDPNMAAAWAQGQAMNVDQAIEYALDG